jgi:tRNA-Thr(GGU) m(6)t(6)A37 methyltransferase TsaA
MAGPYELNPIGVVRSPLSDRATAPKQGNEGSPDAWLELAPEILVGLEDIQPGDRMIVLTWLHQARRDVLSTHPRDDLSHAPMGVFSTRSPDRPNPIGLHPVEVLAVDGLRLQVRDLEAIDGTPIIDLKPMLRGDEQAG